MKSSFTIINNELLFKLIIQKNVYEFVNCYFMPVLTEF